MAKLRKRGKSYYIDYFKDGQRKRKSVGKSKATAEIVLKDLEVKLAREESGLFLREIRMEDFLVKIEAYFENHYKANTLVRYKGALRIFRDFLGTRIEQRVSTFRPVDIEEYKQQRSAKIGNLTLNYELSMLKRIFKLAKLWEHAQHNPLENVKFFKLEKKLPHFYTPLELDTILRACRQPYRDIFTIYLATGMRKDELRFLEIEDINFTRRVFHIRSKGFWKPKTGERDVPIYDDIVPILNRHIQGRQNGFLFATEGTQEPHSITRWYQYLRRLLPSLGIKGCIHTFRHTFGALAVADDMNLRKLQEIFGHSNLKMTEHYSRIDKRDLVTSINKIRSIGTILAQSRIPKIDDSQVIDIEQVAEVDPTVI